MKKFIVTLMFMVPVAAYAQNPMGMSQQDMQKMMQQAQEAQACMEKIDQSGLQGLEERQKQFEEDVKSLCASGKRGAAQDRAMSYVREMTNNPSIKAMKKCGEKMRGMMQNMPFMNQDDEDYSNRHVCDSKM